ncbi:MAG: HYR domain-containing protein [Rubripirellula sp.]|nr:HYR domain-containing protein [Rubripirellula sp.]
MTSRATIRNGRCFRRLQLESLEKRDLLAVSFEFNYLSGDPVGFNHPTQGPTYRAALESAASRLGSWLLHDAVIEMDVNAFAFDGTAIGTASSEGGIRPPAGGFVHHLIPHKILTGDDHNGDDSDGHVDIYFFGDDDVFSYQTDPTNGIADDEIDFQAVIIHELVHTLGFTSATSANGSDDSGDGIFTPGSWSMFDRFISDVNGNRLIEANPNSLNAFQMNIPAWATHSTGGKGPDAGLFFDGSTAKSVYGGRVPLYSPSTFRLESSVAHLDSEGYPNEDFIFAPITHLMSHTLVDREVPQELTLLEKAILTDIGFSIRENLPPVIHAPSGLTLEADSPDGYTGSLEPLYQFIDSITVTDQLDPNPTFSYSLPNDYSLGDHLIQLHAVDQSGNETQRTATLSIVDTTPPTLDVSPPTQTIEATSHNGYPFAEMILEMAAVDEVDLSPTITHDAPTHLPLGSNTLTFTATDFSGNQSTKTISVLIQDTTPPTFTLPTTFQLSVNHSGGADLRNLDSLPTLNQYASDIADRSLTFRASPDQVPIGNTSVTFTATDDSGNETSVEVNLNIVGPFDFGDAVSQYPVALESNGARHRPSPLHLGSQIDFDLDGFVSADASGDGEDEDGVWFLTTLASSPDATNIASVAIESSGVGLVDAWIDFNHDGDWLDAGEQILKSATSQTGLNLLSFLVPAGLELSTTFSRFRLSSAGNLSPFGPAEDGEVEDYIVEVQQSSTQSEAQIDWLASDANLEFDQESLLFQQGVVDSFSSQINQIGRLLITGSTVSQNLTINLEPESILGEPLLSIDGNLGNNTAHWTGSRTTVDLTAGSSIAVANFQTLHLSSTTSQTLILSTEAIKRLNPNATGVTIHLSDGDTISMIDRDQWRLKEPQLVGEQWLVPSYQLDDSTVEIFIQTNHHWHNYLLGSDINNDGGVTAGDALRIINELAARRYSSPLDQHVIAVGSVTSWPNLFFDQNADNRITSLDALRVINDLARNQLSDSSGESIPRSLLSVQLAQPLSRQTSLEPLPSNRMLRRAEIRQVVIQNSPTQTSLLQRSPSQAVTSSQETHTVDEESNASTNASPLLPSIEPEAVDSLLATDLDWLGSIFD